MICDTIGLTADSYQSIYVHGGSEIAEVYGGLNYADPIFYKSQTLTGSAPLYFDAYPEPLTDYTILGNSYQDGTPTPDDPVEVVSVGDKTENLIDTNDPAALNDCYISSAGGGTIQVSGGWWVSGYIPIEQGERYTAKNVSDGYLFYSKKGGASTYVSSNPSYGFTVPDGVNYVRVWGRKNSVMLVKGSTVPSSYIPYGYKIPITCGGVTTPVYIGAEPLHRIGEYADEVSFVTGKIIRRVNPDTMQPYVTPVEENPPVPFPTLATAVGSDLFTVGTTVQPSAVSITGNIKPTGYGQLLDVNNVDIRDKNNEPIFVHG